MPTGDNESQYQGESQSEFIPETHDSSIEYTDPDIPNENPFSMFNSEDREIRNQQSVLDRYNSPDIASRTGGLPWGPGSYAFDRWKKPEEYWPHPKPGAYNFDDKPKYSGDEAELIDSPRARYGFKKFSELVDDLISQPSNSGQSLDALAKQVYEDHKSEKWMWASVPSIRTQKIGGIKLFRWTNMYEVYKFRKGIPVVEKSEIPISVLATNQGPAIPPGLPYTSRFQVTYSTPSQSVLITENSQNPGAPYILDIFQTANPIGFNYNVANRITRVQIPSGNFNFQFNYNPALGTNIIYALIDPGPFNSVRQINFTTPKAFLEKQTTSSNNIYFRNYIKSVVWSNFNDNNILNFVNNFYAQ